MSYFGSPEQLCRLIEILTAWSRYVELAGADKVRYHTALKSYEPPQASKAAVAAAALPRLSPAALQRAMLAEAKVWSERQLKLDRDPGSAERCAHVVKMLHARFVDISGTDESHDEFLRPILQSLGAQEYSTVREFAEDVRLTLHQSGVAHGRPAATGNAAIKPETAEQANQASAAEGAVDAQPVILPKQRRLLGLKFERLLESWVVSPRKQLPVDKLDDASCQTCNADPESKRSAMMRCVECDVGQHSCCLAPAQPTKPPDHWCCRSCSRRLESEVADMVDDVGAAKPKRKHRRTKGVESDANYTQSDEGKYVCNGCGRGYETESAVKGHCTKGCDGGDWKCTWCGGSGKTGQEDGPDGPATLCAACRSRYSSGADAAAKREAGTFVCDTCGQRCATMVGLAAHMRGCDGGQWRCKWCRTEAHGRTFSGHYIWNIYM